MIRLPHRPGLVGPLCGWELTRLARRGQAHRGRMFVLYILLVAFLLTPIFWFDSINPLDLFLQAGPELALEEVPIFANRFALVVLEAMLFATVAITPGYAATSVAEEKERQTFSLLLTTPLSDREIVLGKTVARVSFVLVAAAAGLPLLAGMTLYGGVDIGFLLEGCVLIVSTATLAAAIGVHAACTTSDLRRALLRAYGLTAVFVCGLFVPPFAFISPFFVLFWLQAAWHESTAVPFAGLIYPILQLVATFCLVRNASHRLRFEDVDAGPISRPPSVAAPVPPAEEIIEVHYDPTADNWGPEEPPHEPVEADWVTRTQIVEPPPICDDDPVAWKERHVTGRKQNAQAAGTLAKFGFGGLAIIFICAGAGALPGRERWWNGSPADEAGRLLMTGGTFAAGLYLIPAAIGLASAIARERSRRTLESLFTIPQERWSILWSKLRVVLGRGWFWRPVAIFATALGFGADGGWLLGLAAAIFVLSTGWLVVGLGMFLTIRCATELRAFRLLMPAVVIAVGALVGVWNAIDWYQPDAFAGTLAMLSVFFAVGAYFLGRGAHRLLQRGE